MPHFLRVLPRWKAIVVYAIAIFILAFYLWWIFGWHSQQGMQSLLPAAAVRKPQSAPTSRRAPSTAYIYLEHFPGYSDSFIQRVTEEFKKADIKITSKKDAQYLIQFQVSVAHPVSGTLMHWIGNLGACMSISENGSGADGWRDYYYDGASLYTWHNKPSDPEPDLLKAVPMKRREQVLLALVQRFVENPRPNMRADRLQ